MLSRIFNLFSKSDPTSLNSALQEVEIDPPEATPLVQLTEDSIVSKPEKSSSNPHQKKPFLIDELAECINLLETRLENAKKNVTLSYVFHIRLILALLSAGGAVALIAALPSYSVSMRSRAEKEEYEVKIADAATALNQSLLSFCPDLNTTICKNLTDYKNGIMSWWARNLDDMKFEKTFPKSEFCVWGSCSVRFWSYYNPDICLSHSIQYGNKNRFAFVTHEFPQLEKGDFCTLYGWRPWGYSPFHECNTIVANLCKLTTAISLSLANITSPDQSRYADIFSQEQQLFQYQARANFAAGYAEMSHWSEPLGVLGTVILSATTIGLVTAHIVCCRVLGKYKNDLKKVDDVYELIDDPVILNRLINLAARYGFSLTKQSEYPGETPKGIEASELIKLLKEKQLEAKARLTNRIFCAFTLSKAFEAATEATSKDRIASPMQELVRKIICDEDSGMSPIAQAPRLSA